MEHLCDCLVAQQRHLIDKGRETEACVERLGPKPLQGVGARVRVAVRPGNLEDAQYVEQGEGTDAVNVHKEGEEGRHKLPQRLRGEELLGGRSALLPGAACVLLLDDPARLLPLQGEGEIKAKQPPFLIEVELARLVHLAPQLAEKARLRPRSAFSTHQALGLPLQPLVVDAVRPPLGQQLLLKSLAERHHPHTTVRRYP
mmetsp:Transcript_22523/g.52280  ORF Transcript_22523/g.52280 Transcript_22523/m.52280 type:complete len:200 (-) Transcript_22523:166-765(-)